ncbi:alkanesulfonate monooxygenase SsuD/methylene tetrahydromethanopterin reductase-like flavin-dependent oxidoreductase (luciferase family)/FAD/FMN-containing dehydrogenase [Nocardioides cavernae]|uniref:Alkanesulfonate monooxygenase SsuD/methylene tetrahydromethanopterin reductase-like flavin-dependent oxidoreductase (Luciferase family)/FAD/FMN-containing dehydrogenase n=1 Tax=Nocardioides cavernae TaxID=1921566 RepID=A0A7Y9H1B1_9ACTN|nr:LLM class flavin-dependent oxidoreductase [Nocardioides cavernae]NYE36140.1 alkanesulfonate monooxygenase SsuD/methylene tetrahydromethanopterin reductase-like flavin-dependent oxidoreductase (luciferase family)/FAD/FMN-containing dehydrogenase [Nocardioides cavernae]
MPDYGHPLRFGSFLTPTAASPQRPVDLTLLSEDLGYDLATFQDHPYQPAFLDTWTLMSWAAARTERIHLSGNVLNLPLRQPAVLAKSVASLDLLSGGRVALGLGAGGFWDAIEAYGGTRLTPGQAVDALGEAIEVIRGIWDAEDRSVLAVSGRHHRVGGAKRGPAPSRPVPIWLGALKPRMLRLVGRAADGWLPSLPYLEPGDLQRGMQTIDEAARAAGRDPAEVTRLLNVGAEAGADDLVRLALEDGVSTFIVMGDDEGGLRRFAGLFDEVRERVAEARDAGGTAERRTVRSPSALARRRPGIAYDDLPPALAERAVEPGDRAYARYRSGYLRGGAPGLVLRPRDVAEVQEAVAVAREHRELPLGILSAGHGISGRSLNRGGLVIDVGALDTVEVLDPDAGTVRIGPGATWAEVARVLAPHGLAISSGDYGGVGVGGLATAGGVGWFAREHGLTIDHLTAVELVTADGRAVRASAEDEPDLFWAVRGAGPNFGIATSFDFTAARVGTIAFAQLAFDASDTATFLERWGRAIEDADRSVTGQVILGQRRGTQRVAQAMLVVDHDDPETVVSRLQPIAEVAPLLDQNVALATYDQVMSLFSSDVPQQGQGEPHTHSGLADHLSPDLSREVADLLDAGTSYFFSIRAVGGAVADVPSEATAYAGRSAGFSLSAFGASSGFDDAWERLVPHLSGSYLSFETGTGPVWLERAFPPAHLERLRRLKREWDPTGLFRDNFFIDPVDDAAAPIEAPMPEA